MISIQGLRKGFGKREVIQGLDLKLEPGRRVALIGSNGAGKTTLIRCLLGEYRFGGEIRVDGKCPRQQRCEVLRLVGFVPQLPPPLKMPVGQLVRFVADVADSDPGRIVAVAQRLGLNIDQNRHQPFVRLSGGQKQKLLIAAALGRDTRLLIMDEPAANLDPEARGVFFELLAEKRDKEAVMLISSHRLDEVATLVNRVIELDQGRVVLDDKVDDLVDLDSRLACRIRINRQEAAFARAIGQWGFIAGAGGLQWEGTLAGPDRLRFLGVLSRYAGLLAGLEMSDAGRVSERGVVND
ncbi:MAG: ABC transporter ATP-binding protein [Gammaproteobacteria bacterium]|nr:ABC transporter ATP-binding protein [Gammaproteobacteria bacterium]MBU1654472.1 ABC transporter ATP-binding protein [Gammaproteobacteria bacterium]MBU1962630.1 ABC transporter ATP-binding protein [Gammaproteobacteria bacterium]